MTRAESKYFNTALRMDEAMMELLQEKEFDYITIKELCGRAGVKRSTFYLHYDNTRQLLEECVELLQQRFNAYFAREEGDFLSRLPHCGREELLLITPEYLTPYLTFVRDHRSSTGRHWTIRLIFGPRTPITSFSARSLTPS